MIRTVWLLTIAVALFAPACLAQGGDAAAIDVRPFPREFTAEGSTFHIHPPQFERWEPPVLEGRAAMSVDTGKAGGDAAHPTAGADYGVLRFRAHTQVDKAARAVVLTQIEILDATFPTATDGQAKYLGMARSVLQTTFTISLDELETAMAIAAADAGAASKPVRNDPPEILFTTEPAVLVAIDGAPAWKATASAGVERALNTRSLLLRKGGKHYLGVAGHWAGAAKLDGPWAPATDVDAALESAAKAARDAHLVDSLDPPPDDLRNAFADGHWPLVYVRTKPAELIVVQGEPRFVEIAGTTLSYVENTGADVFVDAAQSHAWYVLVSGRWFRADGSKGPWTHVAAAKLPAGFVNIPPDHPKSGVLASLPGTPESREALIANSIPQTASVDRRSATLSVDYDGAPEFAPIAGTTLSYARNAPLPVIRVSAKEYLAVDKGVWFTSVAPGGPWQVATSVPASIYTIPSSSPLHYVTYVRIYGHDGDIVSVGYTPGYYGTVVSDDVVVYGTGYACDPWIGTFWYGCPATYGLGAYFGWNSWVGWTFGWGWGWYAGWYGPYSPWWGPWWGPAYPYGWWGGGAAAWNVYGHWGNAAVRGTAAAWADAWTGNVGRGARGAFYNERTGGRGAAAINTNIYTGRTTGAAAGIRYNPQTGRVVAGGGAATVNPYTGRAAAGGERTVVNTDSGRVTHTEGGAIAGQHGAAGAGTFDTHGVGPDAKGAGSFHYNADTGTLHHSGVVDINDQIYAGHDGHVYHYDDGQWDRVTRPDHDAQRPDNLDRDRIARERGNERVQARQPSRVDFPGGSGGSRPVGGFRPALGGRGGGGFRRR